MNQIAGKASHNIVREKHVFVTRYDYATPIKFAAGVIFAILFVVVIAYSWGAIS